MVGWGWKRLLRFQAHNPTICKALRIRWSMLKQAFCKAGTGTGPEPRLLIGTCSEESHVMPKGLFRAVDMKK
jgi:hypothetical protein